MKARCVAALESACRMDHYTSACPRCIEQHAGALRAAGCRIVLGTHDDAWQWCNQK